MGALVANAPIVSTVVEVQVLKINFEPPCPPLPQLSSRHDEHQAGRRDRFPDHSRPLRLQTSREAARRARESRRSQALNVAAGRLGEGEAPQLNESLARNTSDTADS